MTRTRQLSNVFVALALAGCDESKLSPAAVGAVATASTASVDRPAAKWLPTTAAGHAVGALLARHGQWDIAVSPDGTRLAYDVALDPIAAPRQRSVFVVDLRERSRTPVRIATGARDERVLLFAPDGNHLALVARAGDASRVAMVDLDTHASRVVATIKGGLRSSRFSQDGRSLFFQREHRIEVLDVATGAARAASPPDLWIHEFSASPDGRSFAAIASSRSRPNYFEAKLVTFDAGAPEARVLWAPKLQLGDPRFSPDGSAIAVVGGLMSDEGNTGGDLFLLPTAGGPAQNLTPARPSTVTAVRWMPSGRGLLVDEIVEDHYALTLVPVADGPVEVLHEAPAAFWGVDLSADGKTVAFVRASFDQPWSVWAGPLRAPAPIAATREPFDPPYGDVKILHAQSDAYSIQSFLIAPKTPNPAAKSPLIVVVHGGPAASFAPAPRDHASLAAEGFYVLLPNPRGSYGRGEAFTAANVKDFGGGDLRDIQASVRAAIAAAPIDPERVGLMGGSYGGFMTMWAVTQTNQFRAAVAVAGISDWQSYYGQTETTAWMPPYFGASVYDDPAEYAKRSPILFIKQAKTPTLVLVGDRDTDCPEAQSREFWAALDAHGVPSELVVFPGEAHGFTDPQHRVESLDRTAAWFRKHLVER
jgi:dipeptidyl aminopeptidase/acylaminoacyl peptidase